MKKLPHSLALPTSEIFIPFAKREGLWWVTPDTSVVDLSWEDGVESFSLAITLPTATVEGGGDISGDHLLSIA